MNVDLVLVDERSSFRNDASSVERRVLDLSGRNGLVHDVQKLAVAVFEAAPETTIKEMPVATRVAINGFGRIGRGFLRAALADPRSRSLR